MEQRGPRLYSFIGFCAYVLRDENGKLLCTLLLFVDDFFIAAAKDLIVMNEVKRAILKKYEARDLGLVSRALGIVVTWSSDKTSVTLSQPHLVVEALQKFNMKDCKTAPTPASTRLTSDMCPKTDAETKEMKSVPYRQAMGVLIYLLIPRIEVCFAVKAVSKFCSNPGPGHWSAVKRILRYLSSRIYDGITYSAESKSASLDSQVKLVGYSDSDYNGCPDSFKSTSGYVFILSGGAVDEAI